MASSQVVSSIEGVLRDRNLNLRDLVNYSCIPVQTQNLKSDFDENGVDFTDLWVHKPQNENQWNSARASENWSKAKDMVLPERSKCGGSGGGGVSSLVKKWSGLEAEAKSSGFSSRSNSGSPRGSDSGEEISVADIIRKLSSSSSSNDSINGGNDAALLPRIRTTADHQLPEQQRCFTPVLHSPRIIRGRQQFNCFLMQRKRDRARELERVMEHKSVSKFQQRGRIQAVLKLKLLRRPADARDNRPLNRSMSEPNRKPQSSILHLSERFSAGVQHTATDSKATSRKVSDSNGDAGKVSVSNQSRQDNDRQESLVSNHREVVDSNSTNGNVSASVGHKEEIHRSDPQKELAGNIQEKDLNFHRREVVDNTLTIGNVSTSDQLQEDDRIDDLSEKIAVTDSLSSREEVALTTQCSGCSSTSNQLEVYYDSQQAKATTQQHCDPQRNLEHFHDEARWKSESSEVGYNAEIEATRNAEQRERQVAGAGDEFSVDWEENSQSLESDCGRLSSYPHCQTTWDDDQHSGFLQESEDGRDWVTDVSRPRSEWEGLRRERYKEMLDPFLDKSDIRELLQRRSVSDFLSGSLRDKIDQMIISRSQRQPTPVNSNKPEEVREKVLSEDEDEEVEDYKEDDYDGSVDEYEQTDDGAAELVDLTWAHNQDRNIGNDSDQNASTSLTQSQSAKFYSQWPYASSSGHHSIELELIYQLKGHMEQLHQEMSEIRNSVNSCINMQVKLQHSIKHEVVAALAQPGQKSRRGSSSKRPSKGNCCVCYEMKIDSLLYRCGHMCTCFKCAHELVWSSGKCPICEAPILDVVRAVYAP